MTRPWCVLRVKPNMERRVRDTLHDAGLSVYVPLERYKPANHWRARHRPLMPGYIFADLPDDDALDLARRNYAVREVMCRDGRLVGISPIVIGGIVLFEAFGAFNTAKRESGARKGSKRGQKKRGKGFVSRWVKGERVKITDGPLEGFMAEIVRADREDRIEVLTFVFGRATPIQLDEDKIERAAA